MKKKVTILIIIGLIALGGYILNEKFNTDYGIWELNWELEVSKPKRINSVFDNRGGFRGEGETYYILEYNERRINKIKDESNWIPVDDTSIDTLSEHIREFQKEVESINYDQEMNYQKIFKEHPLEYTNGDKFYYKLKEDNSYLIAVLNIEKQKLFVMEWIQ